MNRFIRQLTMAAGLMAVSTTLNAQEQSYSNWKYEAKEKRYTSTYTYKKTPEAAPETQMIVYYPQQQKNQWIYFYNNSKQKYWGRCASPKHPSYNKSQMQWSYLQENNEWGQLTIDCPSIPGTQNGPEINSPPPPPGI